MELFAFVLGILGGMALLFVVCAVFSSADEPPDARPPFMQRGKDWW